QEFKCAANALQEILFGDFAELRFRIVQIVDVNGVDSEILETAAELIFQEARCHTMAARSDFFGGENATLNVLFKKITVGIFGHCSIRSQITTLGAKHNFITGKTFVRE